MKVAERILELNHITKTFPGVRALDDVHFDLKPGEIHALIGENGAGKSTLIKVITGVYQPDAGQILFDGQPVEIRSPADSQRLGIAAIYQHVTCYPDLSVTENIFIGHEKISPLTRKIDWKDLHRQGGRAPRAAGRGFRPPRPHGEPLGGPAADRGDRQGALHQRAHHHHGRADRAAHQPRERGPVPDHREPAGQGRLHHLHLPPHGGHVPPGQPGHGVPRRALRGHVAPATRSAARTSSWPWWAGRSPSSSPSATVSIGEEIFRVEGLSRTGYFKDVSFSLRKGEILAITGLIGAGRTEVCEAIYGVTQRRQRARRPGRRGAAHRQPVRRPSRRASATLPEDRLRQGLVLDWELSKNVTLPTLKKFGTLGWLHPKKENAVTKELAEKLEVRAGSVFDLAATLSGGNQQKIIVAKLLAGQMKVIILDEPTKGVDVGAKTAIFNIMNDLAEMGYGIIMVSSEMPEVLGMSDRIVVMREGRVAAILDTAASSQEQILRAAMPATVGRSMRRAATFSESFRELGLLGFIVILCAVFQIRNHNFLTLSNIRGPPRQHGHPEHPLGRHDDGDPHPGHRPLHRRDPRPGRAW